MSRIIYVDGQYLPAHRARVSVFDRGFLFADSIYEVVTVYNGKLIDEAAHLERLERSASHIALSLPTAAGALRVIMRQVLTANRLANGMLYMQVTRGSAPRDHAFPVNTKPTLVVMAKRLDFTALFERAKVGVSALSQPDTRWDNCHIKTTGLLPNVLAKQAAKEAGSYEAIFIDAHGNVTEGSSTNIWMVDAGGTLVTRPLDAHILGGITRQRTLKLAQDLQITVRERAFSLQDAAQAAEMFLTSATGCVTPITRLDGKPIAGGMPGPVSLKLHAAYKAFMEARPSA